MPKTYHFDISRCSICEDHLSELASCVQTHCCHTIFHRACLQTQADLFRACPACRMKAPHFAFSPFKNVTHEHYGEHYMVALYADVLAGITGLTRKEIANIISSLEIPNLPQSAQQLFQHQHNKFKLNRRDPIVSRIYQLRDEKVNADQQLEQNIFKILSEIIVTSRLMLQNKELFVMCNNIQSDKFFHAIDMWFKQKRSLMENNLNMLQNNHRSLVLAKYYANQFIDIHLRQQYPSFPFISPEMCISPAMMIMELEPHAIPFAQGRAHAPKTALNSADHNPWRLRIVRMISILVTGYCTGLFNGPTFVCVLIIFLFYLFYNRKDLQRYLQSLGV